jgi:hypothetical protein
LDRNFIFVLARRMERGETAVLGGVHWNSGLQQPFQDCRSLVWNAARRCGVSGRILHLVGRSELDVRTPGQEQFHAFEVAEMARQMQCGPAARTGFIQRLRIGAEGGGQSRNIAGEGGVPERHSRILSLKSA